MAAATEKRKMPIRSKEITLNGDWAGWTFTGRTNPTMATLDDLISGNYGRIIDALDKLVSSWNFVDEEGQPLPDLAEARKDGTSRELMGRLTLDLAMEMTRALSDAITTPDPK